MTRARRVHALPSLVLVALVAACKPDAPAEPTAPAPSASTPAHSKPAPETVSVDSPRTLAAGTMFTAPAGWKVEKDGGTVVLTAPRGEFRSAIVEAEVATPEEAIAKAWHLLDPGWKRILRLEGTMPARRGWDEIRSYEYKTTPDEQLGVNAAAMRHGALWVGVAFLDNLATVAAHAASAGMYAESITPKGYVKESFAGKTPHPLDKERLDAIRAFLEEGAKALDVPGVGYALVQDGKVVYAGGVGVRELGQPAKIDEGTLFPVSTHSRGLTALLLAKEIEDGKFTWDTPVSQVYPGFKLGDAARTAKVLMKHLPCGCMGLPREDLPFLFAHAHDTPKAVVDLLASYQPSSSFGDTLMAATAGYVAGHVASPAAELGKAYDDAMRARVWGPLGMTATTADFARAEAADHASPHVHDLQEKTRVATTVGVRAMTPVRPALGVWSSPGDLAKYVQMELARGKLPDGKALLSEEGELHRREASHVGQGGGQYGIDKEWGLPFGEEVGALPGFESDLFWLPEAHVGGVLLTNGDAGEVLRRPFVRRVLEALFDGKPEALEDVKNEAERRKAQIARNDARYVSPPAPEVVEKLAARYKNDALGELAVKKDGARTVLDLGEWKSAVASYKNDDGTTSLFTIDPGLDDWEFLIDTQAGKRALVLRASRAHVFRELP